MNSLSLMPQHTYIHKDNSFKFNSLEYECGTKVSSYEILSNGLSSAVNGKLPFKFILKGRFLRDDFKTLEKYINENSGKLLDKISINGASYSSMVLLNANINLSSNGNIGEMTFILQKVV